MEKQEIRDAMMALEYQRRELMRPYFTGLGLTVGQGQPRILSALLDGGGKSQRELAEACHLDATTLSRTLDRMEKAGFVSREPHGKSRRTFRVELTDAGRETARQVRLGLDALDETLCAGLSPAELAELVGLFAKIQNNLAASAPISL